MEATLKNWHLGKGRSLVGDVYGSHKFNDGELITTSGIVTLVECDSHFEAHTYSGSLYIIREEDMDPEYGWQIFKIMMKARSDSLKAPA